MRSYRDKIGPFPERPYYTAAEIERTCTVELSKVGLLPDNPSPVRIERFIEKRFGVVPTYEELPEGILGYSTFGQIGLEAVVVSRQLIEDDSKNSQRRANTTLAHEAGHALFQAHLFALGTPQAGLFGGEITSPKILCRNESVRGAIHDRQYAGKWWEFQANQAIGPLLLPRTLVYKALFDMLVPAGLLGISDAIPLERAEEAVTRLAETFDVNPAVARIRIHEVFGDGASQLTL